MVSDASLNTILAQAEFMPFAPAPCVCCGCLVSDAQRERTYWTVYGNRAELNKPLAPFLCMTQDICILDMITVMYFDKPVHRSGPAPPPCCCIPCTCCGPPVIFSHKPKCCCIDLMPCFGNVIKFAPSNCFGCKQYLICGNPCYVDSSLPIYGGLKNADVFLSKYKAAVAAWRAKAPASVKPGEMVVFDSVEDNIGDFGSAKVIDSSAGAPSSPDGESIERMDA
jgi:hypothetical protein